MNQMNKTDQMNKQLNNIIISTTTTTIATVITTITTTAIKWLMASLVIIPLLGNANSLTRFLANLKTLNIRYVQVEIDESNFTEKISYGRLHLKVPGKIRWEGEDPNSQAIIANGKTMWVYDPGLKQASKYHQEDTLLNTPAILISSPRSFEENFLIDAIRSDEKGTWFDLTPKIKNSLYDYIEARIESNMITQLVVRNRISNMMTRIEFYYEDNSLNSAINNQIFNFIPPEGVDVIQ